MDASSHAQHHASAGAPSSATAVALLVIQLLHPLAILHAPAPFRALAAPRTRAQQDAFQRLLDRETWGKTFSFIFSQS